MSGNNWRLHWFWAFCLKYITAPAVGLVFTFAYPKFINNKWSQDPPYFYAFVIMHMVMIFIVGLFIFPQFFNCLVPATRVHEGKYEVEPQVTIGETLVLPDSGADERILEENSKIADEDMREPKGPVEGTREKTTAEMP